MSGRRRTRSQKGRWTILTFASLLLLLLAQVVLAQSSTTTAASSTALPPPATTTSVTATTGTTTITATSPTTTTTASTTTAAPSNGGGTAPTTATSGQSLQWYHVAIAVTVGFVVAFGMCYTVCVWQQTAIRDYEGNIETFLKNVGLLRRQLAEAVEQREEAAARDGGVDPLFDDFKSAIVFAVRDEMRKQATSIGEYGGGQVNKSDEEILLSLKADDLDMYARRAEAMRREREIQGGTGGPGGSGSGDAGRGAMGGRGQGGGGDGGPGGVDGNDEGVFPTLAAAPVAQNLLDLHSPASMTRRVAADRKETLARLRAGQALGPLGPFGRAANTTNLPALSYYSNAANNRLQVLLDRDDDAAGGFGSAAFGGLMEGRPNPAVDADTAAAVAAATAVTGVSTAAALAKQQRLAEAAEAAARHASALLMKDLASPATAAASSAAAARGNTGSGFHDSLTGTMGGSTTGGLQRTPMSATSTATHSLLHAAVNDAIGSVRTLAAIKASSQVRSFQMGFDL